MKEALLIDVMILFLNNDIEFKNVMEFLALKSGVKSVVRITGDIEQLYRIENRLSTHGVYVQRSPLGLKKSYSTCLSDVFYSSVSASSSESELYISFFGNKESIDKAIQAEFFGNDDLETARILGYPSCCATNYASIREGQHWVKPYFRGLHTICQVPWSANKIAYLFHPHLTLLPDYFPCSVFCRTSLFLSQQYHKLLLDFELTDIEAAIHDHLEGVALVACGEVIFAKYSQNKGSHWISLNEPYHRLRFSPEDRVLPEKIAQLMFQDKRLFIKPEANHDYIIKIDLQDGEGGVMFS